MHKRLVPTWVALAGVVAVGGCLAGERVNAPDDSDSTLTGAPMVVSDPVLSALVSPPGPVGAEIAYVSLRPGTSPDGAFAAVRNLSTQTVVMVPIRGGGFDPVSVAGISGDSISIVVRDAAGTIVLEVQAVVAAARRPIVVRTDPPPRKRDVPLNSAIVIVFSEPIDETTLTGTSIRLRSGSTAVAGSLAFLDPDRLMAAFVPAARLAPGTMYELVVTQAIRDLDGESLEAPVTVEFTTGEATTAGPLSAPSETRAAESYGGEVGITWADNATAEDGFRVERSLDSGLTWTLVRTMLPNATSSSDYGRTPEQLVCYRVFAFSAQGESPPSNTDCTTPAARPTNLTAVGVSLQAIDLAWTDNSAVEETYEVWRAGGGAAYRPVADLPANSISYRDGGVNADVSYTYQVFARKDGGFSESSNIASAAAATTRPAAPSAVSVRPAGSTGIQVVWTDNSSNEDGFRVERSTDGGASWDSAGTTTAWGGPFTDNGRTSEQEVCYRVMAFNGQGASPPSNADCTTPPLGPTNLRVTVVDDSTVDLTWTDNSAVEDGYGLWFGVVEIPDGWRYVELPANATSYRVRLEPWGDARSYAFELAATKDGGWSDELLYLP